MDIIINCVQDDAGDADILEAGTAHFEVYKDKGGEWRWRMIVSNGRIVADSGEGHSSKRGARTAIDDLEVKVDNLRKKDE